ncbi:hypothetical protein FEZ33_12300, partial [Ruoffia tabacinasalis]
KQYNDLGFEDRFKLLVDSEHSRRKSNKLQRLIRQAAFEVPSAEYCGRFLPVVRFFLPLFAGRFTNVCGIVYQ